MMEGTITQKRMMSCDVMLWWATRAMSTTTAASDPQGPLGVGVHGTTAGSGRARVSARAYCLAASTMQKRVAGMASSRASPMGLPQTSHIP